jgi:Flp pilus assembly protein TadG
MMEFETKTGDHMRELWRDQRGAITIEFLGVIPLFILLILVVWQIAVVGLDILDAQAAARDGGRYAASHWHDAEQGGDFEANVANTVRDSFGKDNVYYKLQFNPGQDLVVDPSQDTVRVTVHTTIQSILFTNLGISLPYDCSIVTPMYHEDYATR